MLVATGMRELVTLSASGRMQTPEDIVKAFMLGADQVTVWVRVRVRARVRVVRVTSR